jgi:hypothetical protein
MSELQVPSHTDIRRIARGSLVVAGALDVTPTPVQDVVQAVGLHQENLFELGEDVPPSMLAIIKKLSGRVLGGMAIKERTVYVDASLPMPRRRFTTAHELGHDALPWHEAAYFADDRHTLSPATRHELEREANLYAAELLFGLDRFTEEADSYAPSLGVALELANNYEVSAHAALRRYAATSRHPVALVSMGDYTVRHGTALKVFPEQCATSPTFASKYGPVTALVGNTVKVDGGEAFETLAKLSRGVHDEPIDLFLDTSRGSTKFQAHLFHNGRLRFLLLTRRQLLGRRLRAVNTPQ